MRYEYEIKGDSVGYDINVKVIAGPGIKNIFIQLGRNYSPEEKLSVISAMVEDARKDFSFDGNKVKAEILKQLDQLETFQARNLFSLFGQVLGSNQVTAPTMAQR